MLIAFIATTLIAVSYPPTRHFVYGFKIETAAVPGGADSGKTDTGTISVDVLHLQNDTGTVVNVSEQSNVRQGLKTVMCVTYGTGLVQCNAIQNVTVEEMSLLRLLGRNFLNWAEIDQQRTWHNGAFDGRSRETNNYRITGQTNGLFDIAFDRVLNVPGPDGYVSTTKGLLSYNEGRSVPMRLTQQTVTEPQTAGGNQIVEDLTLTLQSDSLAARSG
jgi:hypothetical protein